MLIPKIKCRQDLANKNGTCYNFAHSFMGTLNGSVALSLIRALMFKDLIRVKTSINKAYNYSYCTTYNSYFPTQICIIRLLYMHEHVQRHVWKMLLN